MRCEEIMKGDVSTVSRDATVQEAARLMADEDIGFLPVVDGSNKAVGTLLSIAEVTVKSHVRAVFAKLNVLSRTEAIAVANRTGLLHG